MRRSAPLHPSAVVALAFLVTVALGTLVLMLPVSRAEPGHADFMTAVFTATSALCVTGLTVVDTGTYWSFTGQVALLVMFQIGGFGMMTTATLLGLWLAMPKKTRAKILLQSETRAASLGDVREVVKLVLLATFVIEAVLALLLALRFGLGYGMPWREAVWQGIFHAISAFNNAGFSPFADNLMGYVGDAMILGPVMAGVVIGGIGFPVLHEAWSRWRRPQPARRWSMHAQMTVIGTVGLLVLGTVGIAWTEWDNARTLAPLSSADKWLASLFTSVVSRTAGFNAIDLSALRTESYVIHYPLMYIGGGSAGTASGVKIATVFVLLAAVWSDIRGERDVVFGGRRIAPAVVRQALSLLVLSSALIGAATLIIVPLAPGLAYEHILFEVLSAFGTVGVSAGITAKLPPAAQWVIIVLMFVGRVGIVTLAVALAAKDRHSLLRFPEEKPLVG